MRRVLPIRASFFVWVVVPALLYGAYHTYGLPHVIWSYSWRDDGQGYSPFAYRYYLDCTYAGPYGVFTEGAQHGKCGWVQFRKDHKAF